jgi:hypothetical protein
LGGVLNVWDLNAFDKETEKKFDHSLRSHKYIALAYDKEFDLVVGTCED